MTTKLTDVIVPEVFTAYINKRTAELSKLVGSGVMRQDADLDRRASEGGKLVNMPFWTDLTGDDEVISDNTPLTPGKIKAEKDAAVRMVRGRAWGANELASALAGSSAVQAIGEKVGTYWARMEQKTLLSILEGVFASPTMADHIHDQSTQSIEGKLILETKQLLGDASDTLTAIMMHSATFTQLQKNNLIAYVPTPNASITFPTYLGYAVIVDDAMPVDTTPAKPVYTTYLFGQGAIARGVGAPVDLTLTETDRDSLAGEDFIINRNSKILHPSGVAFTLGSFVGETPSNTELATGANWKRVYESKQIALAALKHTLDI